MAIVLWRNLRLVIADVIFFILGYLLAILLFKSKGLSEFFSLYFFAQLVVWLLISAFFMKFDATRRKGITRLTWVFMLCNIIILIISVLGINKLFPEHAAGKYFYFAVVLFVSVFELFFFAMFQSYLAARKTGLWESEIPAIAAEDAGWHVKSNGITTRSKEFQENKSYQPISQGLKQFVIQEIGQDPYHKIEHYLETHQSPMLVISTNTRFNIDIQPLPAYNTIVNFNRINEIRYLNKFFEVVNKKMEYGGIFIGRGEVYSTRKERILRYYPPGINYMVYTLDYLLNRVAPKLPFTKQIYFAITKGKERVISRTETLGRLCSCGFEVVEEVTANDLFYFIVRKVKEPYFDDDPTYGVLIKLNRVGKDGRMIGIYKLRTMHPYSEYLQPYIYEKNKLREGGKFKDDFRVTTLGAFARKFWIDEWPMVINLLRGEVKVVGVRPLSRHFFDLYTPELKEKRIRTLPGLIPPYYADMPKTLEEVMESESRYLDEYFRAPLKTDIKYLGKALWQILFKRARSG